MNLRRVVRKDVALNNLKRCRCVEEGTLLQHFETGMECRVQTVSSMAAFDIVASSVSGNFVNFGAHPMLTRGLHLWAGRQRWRLQGRNFTSLSLGGAI